jgi:hypothetical protein
MRGSSRGRPRGGTSASTQHGSAAGECIGDKAGSGVELYRGPRRAVTEAAGAAASGEHRAPNAASRWGTPDLATPVQAVTRSGVDAAQGRELAGIRNTCFLKACQHAARRVLQRLDTCRRHRRRVIVRVARSRGMTLDAETCRPRSAGDRLDYGLAVESLLARAPGRPDHDPIDRRFDAAFSQICDERVLFCHRERPSVQFRPTSRLP